MSNTADTTSPVDAIVRFNKDGKPEVVKLKYARMAANVFAFFRGTDHLFADRWNALRPADEGPAILICGDLHLENFGAYQTDDADFRFDINDFDEALIAPCSVDLARCTTSILLAAEIWQIPTVEASEIAVEYLTSYREAVLAAVRTGKPGEICAGAGDGPIWELLGETAMGTRAKLLDHHTRQNKHGERRIMPSDDKHPPISERKAALVREAVERHGATTPTPEAYEVLDVTGRIVGIGSLGVRRYLVLIAGGGTPDTNRLLDVKEAVPCSVLNCTRVSQPDTGGNDAVRVVRAQRQLQSRPTAALAALDIDERHYRMREMIPDENRSKLDRFQRKPEKLRRSMAVAGQLTAWSHVRGAGSNLSDARSLAAWAESPALDAVLPCAVRFSGITCRDFQAFSTAYADHQLR